MKRFLFLLSLCLILLIAFTTTVQGVSCPIHGNSGAYFTGRTQTVDGVLMYEYKCPQGGGHTFWLRA